MKEFSQEERTMGRKQADIMLSLTRLLREEALISEEEQRKTEQMIEEQVSGD